MDYVGLILGSSRTKLLLQDCKYFFILNLYIFINYFYIVCTEQHIFLQYYFYKYIYGLFFKFTSISLIL